MPKWIYHSIRSSFDPLADNELLSKCFHGETQNPNEAFINIVWTKCPKPIYVSRSIMELGLNSVVLHYNVMYFHTLKLIMVIILKKIASKGIKSILEKWT